MTQPAPIDSEMMQKLIKDQSFRRAATTTSHYMFLHTYFAEYIKYPTADFQRQMIQLTERENLPLLIVTAFRGCGKSTIFTMSYPLWAVLGQQKKKFIVVVSQTQQQAKMHLQNLRREMESNQLLRDDLGPFSQHEEEWSSGSLVIPKYNARITALSSEQSIRGIRHGAARPDLIICDDLEDLSSVKTKDSRDKSYKWFTGDVIPCGDIGTKIIVVGNLLHEDSLLMRLKNDISIGDRLGEYIEFPFFAENEQPLWHEKFNTEMKVTNLIKTVGDPKAWSMEYLLKIIPDEDIVVHPDWIQCYCKEELDVLWSRQKQIIFGVDPAASQNDAADNLAIVGIRIIKGLDGKYLFYVIPNPINRKLTFLDQIEMIKNIYDMHAYETKTHIVVESNGFQLTISQMLKSDGYLSIDQHTGRTDKRQRLAYITPLIKDGRIRFPETGCETLIQQLTGFGSERYDDLADALVLAISFASKLLMKKKGRVHLKPGIEKERRCARIRNEARMKSRLHKIEMKKEHERKLAQMREGSISEAEAKKAEAAKSPSLTSSA